MMADFKSLLKDRGEDRSYHKGMIYYLPNPSDTIYRKVKLKTRGNFRRDSANCKYPPIQVKFGKRDLDDYIFADQAKLKLVIQCQIEDYVLLEYLAYRIYNLLCKESYRVRLAEITYVDINTKVIYTTKYGFFIESNGELENRLNAEITRQHPPQYFMDKNSIITMALFQYLIGNDDWYVISHHNMTILKNNDTAEFLAIPYDFDWSKLVDASYTKPVGTADHQLRERRTYKGLCMTSEEFDWQKTHFNENRLEILSLVDQIPKLSNRDRNKTTKYIEQFYKTLNAKSSLTSIFQKEKCVEELEVPGHKKSPTY